VKTATGFTDAQIFFADQNGPQPASLPYITIKIAPDMRPRGVYDEQAKDTDLTRTAGMEVRNQAFGIRDFSVSVQAFAENAVTYATPTFPVVLPGTNGNTAVGLLTLVQTALSLEGVRYALNQANLAPYDAGTIRNLDAIVETGFDGRAALDVRFYSADVAAEYSGYINEVTGTGTLVEGSPLPNRSAPFDVVGS
jgi:hypothetical protein